MGKGQRIVKLFTKIVDNTIRGYIMAIQRVGPRLTLKEQLLRNPKFRGRKLAVQVTTPAGWILRAYRVVGKQPAAIEEQMRLVDAAREASHFDPVEEVSPILREITLPPEQIITLSAGKYADLGGGTKNPVHDVTLPRDFQLFPLTFGFLRQFTGHPLVDEILDIRRDPSRGRGQDHEMMGYLSMYQALDLMGLINPALAGNVRLRLPVEALIDVLLSAPQYAKEREGLFMLLTASSFRAEGVRTDEFEVELDRGELRGYDEFAYLYNFSGADGYQVGRHMLTPDSTMNTSAVFEVVS